MFTTSHLCNTCMRVELAAVEMSSCALLGVIIQQQLDTVRSRSLNVPLVLDLYVHALPGNVQVHAAHHPWRLQAQQVLIDCGVVYGRSFVGRPSYSLRLPMENTEALYL